MKTLIISITKDFVEPACMIGILQQGVPWVIRGTHTSPLPEGMSPAVHYNQNLAANREAARVMALASDADYFLFVDSDVVLPAGAVNEFLKQVHRTAPIVPGLVNLPNEKHIQCGWFKMKNSPCWVGGIWVADHTLQYFYCPENSLTRTDLIATGCMFISREALSKLHFTCPADKVHWDTNGRKYFVDEAMQFSNDAGDAGYLMYMNGSVICQHVNRGVVENATMVENAALVDVSNQGNSDQGSTDQGSTDQGSTDQGNPDQGNSDQGSTDQGNPDQGSTDQGNPDQASVEHPHIPSSIEV